MKNALMVWGGWDGHEPEKCVRLFAPFLEGNGYEVRISDTLDVYTETEYMRSLSLIVPCWTMGEMTHAQTAGLLEAVAGGVGIAGWHGGMGNSFHVNYAYEFMVGGQFIGHPGGQVRYTVNITDHDDPITAGLADFGMDSEQYYMHTDWNNQVLATTRFAKDPNNPDFRGLNDGATMPVVWKRTYEQGRVFYSSLGHVAKDFDVPEARTIMERGMLWASR